MHRSPQPGLLLPSPDAANRIHPVALSSPKAKTATPAGGGVWERELKWVYEGRRWPLRWLRCYVEMLVEAWHLIHPLLLWLISRSSVFDVRIMRDALFAWTCKLQLGDVGNNITRDVP